MTDATKNLLFLVTGVALFFLTLWLGSWALTFIHYSHTEFRLATVVTMVALMFVGVMLAARGAFPEDW